MTLNIRPSSPSQGKNRYPRHSMHTSPRDGVPHRERKKRIEGMYANLKVLGWSFEFTVLATSPHGFTMQGGGSDALEALDVALTANFRRLKKAGK